MREQINIMNRGLITFEPFLSKNDGHIAPQKIWKDNKQTHEEIMNLKTEQ